MLSFLFLHGIHDLCTSSISVKNIRYKSICKQYENVIGFMLIISLFAVRREADGDIYV